MASRTDLHCADGVRDKDSAQISEIERVPPGYVHTRTPLPKAGFFNLDAYAEDRKHKKDCIPDLQTVDRTSARKYTI